MRTSLFILMISAAGSVALGQLIQLGPERQLFVDDSLIESISGARRVMNPAVKVKHNPVIRPEHPWEGKDVRVSHVFPDETGSPSSSSTLGLPLSFQWPRDPQPAGRSRH